MQCPCFLGREYFLRKLEYIYVNSLDHMTREKTRTRVAVAMLSADIRDSVRLFVVDKFAGMDSYHIRQSPYLGIKYKEVT